MFLRASVEDARKDIERKRQAVIAATAAGAAGRAPPSASGSSRMAAVGASAMGGGGSPLRGGGGDAAAAGAAPSVYASLSREEREGVLASLLAQEAVLSALQVRWTMGGGRCVCVGGGHVDVCAPPLSQSLPRLRPPPPCVQRIAFPGAGRPGTTEGAGAAAAAAAAAQVSAAATGRRDSATGVGGRSLVVDLSSQQHAHAPSQQQPDHGLSILGSSAAQSGRRGSNGGGGTLLVSVPSAALGSVSGRRMSGAGLLAVKGTGQVGSALISGSAMAPSPSNTSAVAAASAGASGAPARTPRR